MREPNIEDVCISHDDKTVTVTGVNLTTRSLVLVAKVLMDDHPIEVVREYAVIIHNRMSDSVKSISDEDMHNIGRQYVSGCSPGDIRFSSN